MSFSAAFKAVPCHKATDIEAPGRFRSKLDIHHEMIAACRSGRGMGWFPRTRPFL
jgi:hypothetical protein